MVHWALSASEAIQAKLKECYKQTRHDTDRNQPLSVQPWGSDSLKRRYWLIEGRDDTHFRLYRESNPALKNHTWWSVAGTIPELRAVAETLGTEKSHAARDLSEKILHSIPRFEGAEEVRTTNPLPQECYSNYISSLKRNENDVTIAWRGKQRLLAPNLDSRFTKAGREGRESNIHFPMRRKTQPRKRPLLESRLETRLVLRILHPRMLDLHIPQVAVKSEAGLVACMAIPCSASGGQTRCRMLHMLLLAGAMR